MKAPNTIKCTRLSVLEALKNPEICGYEIALYINGLVCLPYTPGKTKATDYHTPLDEWQTLINRQTNRITFALERAGYTGVRIALLRTALAELREELIEARV